MPGVEAGRGGEGCRDILSHLARIDPEDLVGGSGVGDLAAAVHDIGAMA